MEAPEPSRVKAILCSGLKALFFQTHLQFQISFIV
jgi:hypothetical protein